MNYAELIESLRQVASTTFGLDDPAINRAFLACNLPRRVETIEQTADYEIVRTGDGHRGWIFLHNISDNTVDYVVQYHTKNWPWLGNRSVSQLVLWRDVASPFTAHITERMFFDYLLPRYHLIMSDKLQTSAGRDFWSGRMRDAAAKHYKVGVAYLNQKHVEWFDPARDGSFRSWLRAQDTFGPDRKHEAIRYVIAD
jgi:hypothetical protein